MTTGEPPQKLLSQHGNQKQVSFLVKMLPFLAFAAAISILLAIGICSASEGGEVYFCDAESVVQVDGKPYFEGKRTLFRNGQTQTAEFAHSGKFSSKVWEQEQYGLACHFEQLKPGEIFEVTVWRKSDEKFGQLTIEGSWGMMRFVTSSDKAKPGGWEELELTVMVPAWVENANLKIYCFNNRAIPAFFDDLRIVRKMETGKHEFPQFEKGDIQTLDLQVSEKSLEKINKKRSEALHAGILSTDDEDWVKAKIESESGVMKAKVRLKGDWPDHLQGEKWSFRVKLDDSSSWNRMTVFSLQSPDTRHFLDEWVFHQWLASEGVLTPRYGFVNLKLNGRSLGIFAYEEHFTKTLLESQKRREGPIVKFNEEGFWNQETDREANGFNFYERTSVGEAAHIDAFGMKPILKDSLQLQLFETAQNLLWNYKVGKRKPSEIFDLDKMARYFAIMDIAQAQHGLIWHNQRFYFNPVTSKLEPIGFDAYTTEGPFNWIRRPFLAHSRHIEFLSADFREYIFEKILADSAFVELYVNYLYKFTEKKYINNFFRGITPELHKWELLLCAEYHDYWYNPEMLFNTANEIRLAIQPGKDRSLKTWTQGPSGGGKKLHVENYHSLPIRIAGFGPTKDKITKSIPEVWINSFPGTLPADYTEIIAPSDARFIFFRIPGIDSTYHETILEWPAPGPGPLPADIFAVGPLKSNPIYKVKENLVSFTPGMHQSRADIIIPEGYTVIFEGGCSLDLVQGAKFISRSNIIMKGEEETPVRIFSSDQSAGGFSVLQPKGKSIIRYTNFEGLKNLSMRGWVLTGAVTFYEAEVSFGHCNFLNNHCEDGLNLVRCHFGMDLCLFENTSGDAFDADFCEGTVSNSQFRKTGNDGMDFSGSKVRVLNCRTSDNGDKGVSVGEESTAEIENLSIENANVGIASKDLSRATVNNLSLKKVKTGFQVFRKKIEYGNASLTVMKYSQEEVGKLHEVQEGSEIIIDGKTIQGGD